MIISCVLSFIQIKIHPRKTRCDGREWLKKGPVLALVETVTDIML